MSINTNTIHFDISELVAKPLRTGIQRIERQLIQHWPGPAPLVPLFFDTETNQFCELPLEVFQVLTNSNRSSIEDEQRSLSAFVARRKPLGMNVRNLRILNTELFFCPWRSAAYIDLLAEMKKSIFWISMDFLPYLYPNYFQANTTKGCMHFLRALREVRNVGFISYQTRDDYRNRIVRRPETDGPVFVLGGDGLELGRQKFDSKKISFLLIGTIEPRKRVAEVLEAFEALSQRGSAAKLMVVGRLLPSASRERELLGHLATCASIHYSGEISDDELKVLFRRARATLFVSEAEGFGIPLYESLSSGIPVICSARGIPSLASIAAEGQIRLEEVSAASIANAVEHLMNASVARRIWDEASSIRIPTWKDFARDIAHWVQTGEHSEGDE
jgi:glycosyltransferase involved in cell wall biosynthesis